jgi:hypothetical protein
MMWIMRCVTWPKIYIISLVKPSNESDSALWDLAKNLISALCDMTQNLIARRETLTLAWSRPHFSFDSRG